MSTCKISLPKGFTLIELLVVIAVLGVLAMAAIAIINPVGQMQKARDAQRKSDLKQVQTALELFNQDNGRYPNAGEFPAPGAAWGNYMKKMPADPAGKAYAYVQANGGTGYRLYASLDRDTDPQLCNAGGAVCANAGSANCGGTCNYGVTSSDLSP